MSGRSSRASSSNRAALILLHRNSANHTVVNVIPATPAVVCRTATSEPRLSAGHVPRPATTGGGSSGGDLRGHVNRVANFQELGAYMRRRHRRSRGEWPPRSSVPSVKRPLEELSAKHVSSGLRRHARGGKGGGWRQQRLLSSVTRAAGRVRFHRLPAEVGPHGHAAVAAFLCTWLITQATYTSACLPASCLSCPSAFLGAFRTVDLYILAACRFEREVSGSVAASPSVASSEQSVPNELEPARTDMSLDIRPV